MATWNRYSHVTTCPACEGAGYVHSHARPSVDNPYPEKPCDCGMGPHDPECEVCGCTTEVDGYDCIVCDLIDQIPLAKLNAATLADLAKAMTVAMQARIKADTNHRWNEAIASRLPELWRKQLGEVAA